jgi:hypothetical protein
MLLCSALEILESNLPVLLLILFSQSVSCGTNLQFSAFILMPKIYCISIDGMSIPLYYYTILSIMDYFFLLGIDVYETKIICSNKDIKYEMNHFVLWTI